VGPGCPSGLLTVAFRIKLIVDNLSSCSGRSIFDLQARSKETGMATMTNVVDPQLLFAFFWLQIATLAALTLPSLLF
jgi:hypothetical protein